MMKMIVIRRRNVFSFLMILLVWISMVGVCSSFSVSSLELRDVAKSRRMRTLNRFVSPAVPTPTVGLTPVQSQSNISPLDPSIEIMRHSPLITSLMVNFKQFITGQKRSMPLSELGNQIKGLISGVDVIIISLSLSLYKPILKFMYVVMNLFNKPEDTLPYEKSLMGRFEYPTELAVSFPIFLFVVDLVSILFAFFGFQFHIKGNIPQLFSNIAYAIILGSFLTRFKDWLFRLYRQNEWKLKVLQINAANLLHQNSNHSVHHSNHSSSHFNVHHPDHSRQKTFDELTSAIIWFIVGFYCLQTFSRGFGIGIGSIFALGGIGSASFVLALRSTMENLLGGILLKLQDKFRLHEKISVPKDQEGYVEEIHWLTTKLRKDDDSTISIPNSQFIQGEVINWSRTPYRLFKTTVSIKESHIHLLPKIIEQLKSSLSVDDDIEKENRDLIIAATGFNAGNILIEVQARLKGNTDKTISSIKTKVVDKIAVIVDNIYKAHNITKI